MSEADHLIPGTIWTDSWQLRKEKPEVISNPVMVEVTEVGSDDNVIFKTIGSGVPRHIQMKRADFLKYFELSSSKHKA